MTIRFLILSVLSFFILAGCTPKPITLSAPDGKFLPVDLGPAASMISMDVQVFLTSFSSGNPWRSAAYVGLYQAPDRDNSFQIVIVRNAPSDNFLLVGYRIIEMGRETTRVATLESVPTNKPVDISLFFSKGKVTLSVNGGQPVQVDTKLSEVIPYASVSSGTAQFVKRS